MNYFVIPSPPYELSNLFIEKIKFREIYNKWSNLEKKLKNPQNEQFLNLSTVKIYSTKISTSENFWPRGSYMNYFLSNFFSPPSEEKTSVHNIK